jgi:putative nucleotidyltransferase with HDIG domain
MALNDVEADAHYHPERNQLNHTVQVALIAAKETDDVRLIRAAILHDVGKAQCFAEHGNSHGHEDFSAKLLADNGIDAETVWLVSQHIRVMTYQSGEMSSKKARALAAHPLFPLLIQLRRFDIAGRKPGIILNEHRRASFEALCVRVGIEVGAWP